MEQTVFIRSFVKNKDKKSLLEQPKCVFIRLDILQVYGLNSVGLFSSSTTFADSLLRFIVHLSAHILESNFWFFLNVFFGIFLRNWYIQIYCTTNSFTTTLYFKFRIFFRTSVIRGKNGKSLKLRSEIQKYAQNDNSGVDKYALESGKVGSPVHAAQ